MKKCIWLLILILTALSSCKSDKHSYSTDWSYDSDAHWKTCEDAECDAAAAFAVHSFIERASDESTLMICSVCGFTKEVQTLDPHIHETVSEYTTSSTHHWYECALCNGRYNEEEHVFGENTVVTPPSSEHEGVAERTCAVCGKISKVSLERLPEKMSEEEWKRAFELTNVRITEKSKIGSMITESSLYEVDGALVAISDGTGTAYQNREVLSSLNFAEHYYYFSHYGDGVYKSDSLEIKNGESKLRLQSVIITFNQSTLDNVSYSINLPAFGKISYSYTFSNWGEVSLSPTYLSTELLNEAISTNPFSASFSLTYQKYDSSGKYTETQLTVLEGSYVCKNYQNGVYKGNSTGNSSDVAEGLAENLSSIFGLFPENSFIYEEEYNDYTYVGLGIEIDGLGILKACDVVITDGRIISIILQFDDETACYYDFQYDYPS